MIGNLRLWSLTTVIWAGAASADTTLRYTAQGDCPAIADSVEISGALIRFDVHELGEEYYSVFDGAEELYTTMLPAQHKYAQVEVDEDALDYTGDVADSAGKYVDNQMQKMQAMLPPASRGPSCATAGRRRPSMASLAASSRCWRTASRSRKSVTRWPRICRSPSPIAKAWRAV